jgi:hypothetical protein
MAKKETITYDDEKVVGFNLTNMVGYGGFNDKGDVMLIQAMVNFIVEGTGTLSKLGIKSKSDLPDITGSFGGDTGFLIMSFQLKWMSTLTAQRSGLLFPGYYKDKIPAMGADDRRQAMFLLHQFAQESAARLNETDYTVAILKEFPDLRKFIK